MSNITFGILCWCVPVLYTILHAEDHRQDGRWVWFRRYFVGMLVSWMFLVLIVLGAYSIFMGGDNK